MPKTLRRAPTGAGLALIQGHQWAITESGWQSLIKAAAATPRPRALQAVQGDWVDGAPSCLTVCDGIATIRVRGPLMMDANWLWSYYGWTSYEMLARAYAYALDEPSIRAIVFDFDSPGGVVAGVSELAAILYAGRQGGKPQEGFVSGMCCSAALWLLAAIGPVNTSDVGLLGSIGTMFSYEDTRKFDQKIGIVERSVISSQTPNKNADPNTPTGKSELQRLADELADVFISALARYRSVPRATVLADFGQGSVLVGASAVDAGLADDVTTQVQLVQDLLEELESSSSRTATLPMIGGRASTPTTTEAGMAKTTARAGRRSAPQGSAAASDPATGTTTDEQGDELEEEQAAVVPVAKAKAKSKAKGKAAADDGDDDDDPDDDDGADDDDDADDPPAKKKTSADARAALIAQAKTEERERVAQIRALDGPDDVIQACVDDAACSPEAAAYRILTGKASAPKKNRLAALRGDDAGPHASATAPKPGATTPKEAAKASVDRYYQNTKPRTGVTSRNG